MSGVWTDNDARTALAAHKREAPEARDSFYRITPQNNLLVFSGPNVVKYPSQYPNVELMREVCNTEFRIGYCLPTQARVVIEIVWLSLRTSQLSKKPQGGSIPGLRMRRLPKRSDLSALACTERIPVGIGTGLGVLLRRFHDACPALPPEVCKNRLYFEQPDLADYIARLDTTRLIPGFPTTTFRTWIARELSRLAPMVYPQIARYAESGAFREVHGDLHMGNICFAGNQLTFIDPNPHARRRQNPPLFDIARIYLELFKLNKRKDARLFLASYGRRHDYSRNLLLFYTLKSLLADIVNASINHKLLQKDIFSLTANPLHLRDFTLNLDGTFGSNTEDN